MSKKLIWNNCKKIGEVKKSDRTKVVIELVARDGIKYMFQFLIGTVKTRRHRMTPTFIF